MVEPPFLEQNSQKLVLAMQLSVTVTAYFLSGVEDNSPHLLSELSGS